MSVRMELRYGPIVHKQAIIQPMWREGIALRIRRAGASITVSGGGGGIGASGKEGA